MRKSSADSWLLWLLGAAGLISAAGWILAAMPAWLAIPAIVLVAVWFTRAVDARVRARESRRKRSEALEREQRPMEPPE